MELQLLHTADLHHRLTPARAEWLRELRETHQALLFDCGDAIQAPNIFALPWPERAIRLMNQAGYDAMCLGNREYSWRRSGLLRKTGEAFFPVLSANLVARRGSLGHIRRWTILEAADQVRVGVFGLTEMMIEPGAWWERLAASRFIPPLQAAQEAVAALREKVDVIVALTHYGRGNEDELITIRGLDLVLCGHQHVACPSLKVVKGVAVARTFHHARGVSALTYDGAHWRQESVTM